MQNNLTTTDYDYPHEWAIELRWLAARARQLGSTLSGEKGREPNQRWDICMDIAADLSALANRIKPLDGKPIDKPKKRSDMRQITVERYINGRRVRVQSARKPFAVFVEGRA